MGYQPMPSAAPPPPPQSKGAPPSNVVLAVRLMFINAAIGIIGVIVVLAFRDDLRKQIRDKNPGYSASKLDSVVNTAITIGVVIGVVILVLYVLLALQVRKGKNWARIVTWILAGLGVLSGLASLA